MNINGNKSVFKGCEMKKKRLVLFIFFICIILFFILINTFDLFNINNNVHAVYAEEKINFDIVGNEIVSKNKKFKLIVPDNDFEEWKKYNWENEPEFSDNIDTREAYQFVIDKGGDIFYIEGSYRKGEEEYFKRCIKQIILSIKTL